jgi:hypothetical protein
MILAVRALRATGLLRLAALVPATLQPIMDVRLTKRNVTTMGADDHQQADGSIRVEKARGLGGAERGWAADSSKSIQGEALSARSTQASA